MPKRKADNNDSFSSSEIPAESDNVLAEETNGVTPKKHIIINAFDMSSVGHLWPGQWKNPKDNSTGKRKLSYWINLAKILERGNVNALFLADTFGGHTTYGGKIDDCIRRAAQWPMTDPSIPLTAMAAVTKNLAFAITTSTSFENPFVLAKRFSTLDHLTDGRIGWNIVTGWKKAAFQAIGIEDPPDHDERYEIADEYMRVLYKLWEGSWSDDAITENVAKDEWADPERIREINHHGKYFNLDTRHIVDPSPQRTPFLFQAGTSSAGSKFGATHAEAIFVSGLTPASIRPKISNIRALAAAQGRDPSSIKFFATICPIIGKTDEEAQEKFAEAKKNASVIGGLVLFSSWTGIDLSKIPLDEEISAANSTEVNKITSIVSSFETTSGAIPKWTPRVIAQKAAFGGLGPMPVGSPQTVADEFEMWMNEGDLDGFNVGYVTTPGSFEDLVDLLIPELRKRHLYPDAPAVMSETELGPTARERVYGKGQSKVRDDHVASRYKYDVYDENQKVSEVAETVPEGKRRKC